MSHFKFLDRLLASAGKREELCILNGGSPFWLNDLSCFTDQLFTGRKIPYYRYCGLTSLKSMSDSRVLPRRVEQFSSKNSTKAIMRFPAALFSNLISDFSNSLNQISPSFNLAKCSILKKEIV